MVANRLSEDPHVTVLLLEAGGSENIISDIPLAYQALQGTPVDWQYETVPQEASCFGLREKRSKWPRGKVLGGSSTINAMVYTRGARSDYDNWVREGAIGWSWEEVFPYFLKSEDNRDPSIAYNGESLTLWVWDRVSRLIKLWMGDKLNGTIRSRRSLSLSAGGLMLI